MYLLLALCSPHTAEDEPHREAHGEFSE
jgi:hypothetical protein